MRDAIFSDEARSDFNKESKRNITVFVCRKGQTFDSFVPVGSSSEFFSSEFFSCRFGGVLKLFSFWVLTRWRK